MWFILQLWGAANAQWEVNVVLSKMLQYLYIKFVCSRQPGITSVMFGLLLWSYEQSSVSTLQSTVVSSYTLLVVKFVKFARSFKFARFNLISRTLLKTYYSRSFKFAQEISLVRSFWSD